MAKSDYQARDDKNMRRVAKKLFGTSKDIVPASRKTYPDRTSVKRDVK